DMAIKTKNRLPPETPAENGALVKREIILPKLLIEEISFTIQGVTSLIVHAFGEKARRQMLAKQKGEAQAAREKKNPKADFEAARHKLSDGQDGFPAVAIKKAMVSACSFVSGITKVAARGGFYVNPGEELVAILGPEPKMREDIVRVGGK